MDLEDQGSPTADTENQDANSGITSNESFEKSKSFEEEPSSDNDYLEAGITSETVEEQISDDDSRHSYDVGGNNTNDFSCHSDGGAENSNNGFENADSGGIQSPGSSTLEHNDMSDQGDDDDQINEEGLTSERCESVEDTWNTGTTYQDTGDIAVIGNVSEGGDMPDTGDVSDMGDADVYDGGNAGDMIDTADVSEGGDVADVSEGVDDADVSEVGDIADVSEGGDVADVSEGGDAADVSEGENAADVYDAGDVGEKLDKTTNPDANMSPIKNTSDDNVESNDAADGEEAGPSESGEVGQEECGVGEESRAADPEEVEEYLGEDVMSPVMNTTITNYSPNQSPLHSPQPRHTPPSQDYDQVSNTDGDQQQRSQTPESAGEQPQLESEKPSQISDPVTQPNMIPEILRHDPDSHRPRTPSGPGPETPTEDTLSPKPNDLSFESSNSESDRVPEFEMITQNEYVSAFKQRSSKDKKMVCSCEFNAENPSTHCTDTCLNKVLMIECNSRCPCGDLCKNKRFQRVQYAKTEAFYTGAKGWGLRADQDILPGDFVMEYCGEVVNQKHFEKRMDEYGKKRFRHYYFMTISKDEIIDAQNKGNLSRFINHSCDPNCETQKWRVNGVLRIGFFALKHIKKGEELCFDYQYQRYGDDVQKCFCGTDKCRGTLGEKVPDNKSNTPLRDEKTEKRVDKKSGVYQSIAKITREDGSLISPDYALQLSRLMVQTDLVEHRLAILKILQSTNDPVSLKRFLTYQGLNIIWSWMVDLSEYPTALRNECKLEFIKVLKSLPITTKNAVEDSKVIKVLKKWVDNEQSSNSSQADSSEEGVNSSVVAEESDSNSQSEGSELYKQVVEDGQVLLNQWNTLKEVFKIPKKDKKQNSPAPPGFLAGGSDSSPEQQVRNRDSRHHGGDSRSYDRYDSRRDSRFDRRKSPEREARTNFLLSSFLHSGGTTDNQSNNLLPPAKKMELSKEDYELPMSFGSTKREYGGARSHDSTNNNTRGHDDNTNNTRGHDDNRKRRNDRDDYSRYEKRSRNSGRYDRYDSRGGGGNDRYDRHDNRNSDRHDNRHDNRGANERTDSRNDGGRKTRFEDRKNMFNERYGRTEDRFDDNKRDKSRDRSRENRRSKERKEDLGEVRNPSRFDNGGKPDKKSRFEPLSGLGSGMNEAISDVPTSLLPNKPDPIPTQQSGLMGPGTPNTFAPSRLPFTPGVFNPRAMGQFAGSLPPMYNTRLTRPRLETQRFPPRFTVDSSVPRPKYEAMRLPGNAATSNPKPNRYEQPWQVPSRFPSQEPAETPIRPPLPQPTSRFQSPNMAQIQHDIFKHISEQGLPTGLLVPPTGMPIFPPHFPGHTGTHPMFNVAAAAQSVPSAIPVSLAPPTQTKPTAALPSEKTFSTDPRVADQHTVPPDYTFISPHQDTIFSPFTINVEMDEPPKAPESELKKPIVKKDVKPEADVKLPAHWRTAKDNDGKVYYYHAITRETQWDPPTLEEKTDIKAETPASPPGSLPPANHTHKKKRDVMVSISSESKPEKVQKKSDPTENLDPASKRALTEFKSQMAKVVVNILGKYNKVDCKVGRIMDNNDFKYLARKLTHGLTEKEMSRKAVTDLAITDNLKQRVKLYITNYMGKFGPIYHKT